MALPKDAVPISQLPEDAIPIGDIPSDAIELSQEKTQKNKPNIALDFLKWSITPKISPDVIMKNPIASGISTLAPIYNAMSGVPNSAVLNPKTIRQEGADTVSSQTSPLAIAGNIGIGLGLGGKMLGRGAGKVGNFLSGKGLPVQSEIVSEELNGIRKALGSFKESDVTKFYETPLKNVKKLNGEISNLSLDEDVATKLKSKKYGIEFLKDGSIKPNVGNMDKVTQALGDMLSSSEWDKFSNMSKAAIKRAYGVVRDAITEAAPETKSSVDAFHHFLENVYNPVIRKVEQGGRSVEKPLRDALAIGADNAVKGAIEGASQISPEIKNAIKYIKNYRRAMAGLKLLVVTGGLGGGYKILH